jgi:hypothetical protein
MRLVFVKFGHRKALLDLYGFFTDCKMQHHFLGHSEELLRFLDLILYRLHLRPEKPAFNGHYKVSSAVEKGSRKNLLLSECSRREKELPLISVVLSHERRRKKKELRR